MKIKGSPWRVTSAVVFALSLVALYFDHEIYQRSLDQEKARVLSELGVVRAELESQINTISQTTQAIATIIASQDGIEPGLFNSLAADYVERNRSGLLRSIALAPNNRVRQLYPPQGSALELGTDYLQSLTLNEGVSRTLELRRTFLAGPVSLDQGQHALIAHTPVMRPQYWGMVSAVLDLDVINQRVRDYAASRGLLTAACKLNSDGVVVASVGSNMNSVEEAVSLPLQLANANWRLYAIPQQGWHVPWQAMLTQRLTAAVAVIMVGILFWVFLQSRARIHQQALQDSLTGLPNRHYLTLELNRVFRLAQKRNTSFAVLTIDVDNFKLINDTFGHKGGDQVLMEFGKRLRENMKPTCFAARWGGDEFVIIVGDLEHEAAAQQAAQRMIETVLQPVPFDDMHIHAQISVGVAIYPDSGASIDELMRNADRALYHVKENGRNSFALFGEEVRSQLLEQQHLEKEIRRALAQDELELFYQPKVYLESGKLAGVEALLRWKHPQKGMLYPDSFIPVAEKSELILEIGAWVLRKALMQHIAWREQGMTDIPIAINVSSQQIIKENLTEKCLEQILHMGIEPRLLEIELTESTLLEDTKNTLDALHHLKRSGMTLSLDDFGTGFSSLNYLRTLPFDKLKLDKSFTLNMLTDPDTAFIVDSIIRIAHGLGLEIVAEGVETQEQFDYLKSRGCSQAQGHFIARGLSVSDFEEWCRARKVLSAAETELNCG